jgi:hypothetical protein
LLDSLNSWQFLVASLQYRNIMMYQYISLNYNFLIENSIGIDVIRIVFGVWILIIKLILIAFAPKNHLRFNLKTDNIELLIIKKLTLFQVIKNELCSISFFKNTV